MSELFVDLHYIDTLFVICIHFDE